MPKTPRLYQRLTRPVTSVGNYDSLWLGADHLLIVKSNGYTENYQRLQLRDIKAFFIVDSDRRLYWGLTFGIIAAISGALGTIRMAHEETVVAAVIFFVPALILFLINFFLGPSCRVLVVTGVQTARLPALTRQRKAHKVLGRLEPLIEAAQADFTTVVPVVDASPEAPPIL